MDHQHNGDSQAPVRIAVVGYGNLGRGVEKAVGKNPDTILVGVYTRRSPASIKPASGVQVHAADALLAHRQNIDVLILCGGSKDDLPVQTPEYARHFNVVDSFDTHARIPEHFARVDAAAQAGKTTALISAGWDPGLFSVNRVMSDAFLPDGADYTFWGKGLSQGHSDAIRHVPGVAAGVQYTLPVEVAIQKVRSGTRPELSTREKHQRECFVVLKPGADAESVRRAIVTMPNYFSDYDTTVHFIDAEELARNHAGMAHGGFVIRSGDTSDKTKHVIEYRLQLDSNPEFTSSVLVTGARAVHRLHQAGQYGCKTMLDLSPALLSPKTGVQLRAAYL